ncbi:monocarboxylate transporter 14-like [Haemaphysalis longicornis]
MAPPGASLRTADTKTSPSLIDKCWELPIVAASATFLFAMPQTNNGIFYVLFIEELGASREEASWPQTTVAASTDMMGFLVAAIQHRVSILSILLFGALLCPLSIISCAFVPNIKWMLVTWGLLYGFSQGLLTIGTSIVIVEYFQKYRSVSTGMKFVGRALTGIVGPSLLTFLKTAYGFKGTLLVVGGLLLNTVPLMLLLRHPRPLYLPACQGCRVVKQPENKTSVLVDRAAPDRANENIANTSTKHREVDVRETSSKLIDCVEATEDNIKTAPISVVCNKGSDSSELPSHLYPKSKNVSNIFGRTLVLLKLPCFYVVLLAITAIDFTFPILNTTVVDYGQDKGLREEDAAQLTSLLSFGGLCGHVLIPFIGDIVVRARCGVAGFTSVIAAVCFLFMPHVMSFASVSVVTFVAGLQFGYLRIVKAVLVADYLGVHNLALCIGLMGTAALPLRLGEPPLVGMFRDNGGSYDNLYRTCAAIVLAGAFLLFAQTCLDAKNSKRYKISSATVSA